MFSIKCDVSIFVVNGHFTEVFQHRLTKQQRCLLIFNHRSLNIVHFTVANNHTTQVDDGALRYVPCRVLKPLRAQDIVFIKPSLLIQKYRLGERHRYRRGPCIKDKIHGNAIDFDRDKEHTIFTPNLDFLTA